MAGLLRVKEVRCLEGFRLRPWFTDDTVVERDVSELMRGLIFEDLRRDSGMFLDDRVEGGTVV